MNKKQTADRSNHNPEIAREMEIFNEFLKKKDLKVTSQRMLVAETI